MDHQTENFESFYSERLLPRLTELEPEANDVSKWKVAGIAALFLCVACFIISQSAAAVLFILILFLSIYKFLGKRDIFVANYKQAIIREIIDYLNPDATYEPTQYLSPRDYEYSGLYTRMYDTIRGEDLVRGLYKGVNYHCSEIETYRDTIGRHTSTMTIFKGLFFIAPIRNTYGATYVWPADDVQLPVSIADYHFDRFITMPEIQRIDVGNAEFQNHFSVYTTNGSSAKAILDHTMMERMLRFKKQIDREVRFSFVNGFCFVAIPMNENLFEPSVSDPKDKEKIKEYFFGFLLILSIINQLDLISLT